MKTCGKNNDESAASAMPPSSLDCWDRGSVHSGSKWSCRACGEHGGPRAAAVLLHTLTTVDAFDETVLVALEVAAPGPQQG